jgi:hypothetical protein
MKNLINNILTDDRTFGLKWDDNDLRLYDDDFTPESCFECAHFIHVCNSVGFKALIVESAQVKYIDTVITLDTLNSVKQIIDNGYIAVLEFDYQRQQFSVELSAHRLKDLYYEIEKAYENGLIAIKQNQFIALADDIITQELTRWANELSLDPLALLM